MNRSFRDEKMRDTYGYGYGLSDVFKSMFNSATKKIASQGAKKIAQSAIESAAKSSADVLGKKSAEVLADKIFNNTKKDKKIEPIIEESINEVTPNKGDIIEKELKKIYKRDDDISKKFNELL